MYVSASIHDGFESFFEGFNFFEMPVFGSGYAGSDTDIVSDERAH